MTESVSNTASILGDSIIESTTETSNPVARRPRVQEVIYVNSADEEDDQTEQVDDDVMETDDDEAEYLKARAKQPRLDPEVAESGAGAEANKKQSEAAAPVEEEVQIRSFYFASFSCLPLFNFGSVSAFLALLDLPGAVDQFRRPPTRLAQVRPSLR